MNLEPICELVRLCQKIKRLNDGGFPTKNTETNLYYAAYEAGPALSQLLEAVTWQKCSERMPEPETLVLFYTESKSYFIGDCDPVTGWWTKAGKSMTGVIYWLPLSPPEGK